MKGKTTLGDLGWGVWIKDDICLQWDELEGELKLKKEREERNLFRDNGRGSAERQ